MFRMVQVDSYLLSLFLCPEQSISNMVSARDLVSQEKYVVSHMCSYHPGDWDSNTAGIVLQMVVESHYMGSSKLM